MTELDGESPSRDDVGTTRPCPVCTTGFTPVGRQAYCSTACRKRAWRRRHQPAAPTVPTGRPRRELSAYECPSCGERTTGTQRCDDCGTFGRSLGLAGTCPHCDGIIAATDLDPTP